MHLGSETDLALADRRSVLDSSLLLGAPCGSLISQVSTFNTICIPLTLTHGKTEQFCLRGVAAGAF